MKKKRIIVMGFMGGCPIAGVVWQHIHYIVGLQRLGHEVYYIEDSARYPYNPVTYEENENYAYAAEVRSEEHTSELQSPRNISYAVFCSPRSTRICSTPGSLST